ncbi:hypothetical protein LTR84_006421 [Exophiala bonariae]|uniref:Fungal N-terminal domain-containing protein n=1 Tax=Exophiala bonariae TaxID=1690606 RepID=A0AAV9N1F9_9EURO|nr:hypothetical protein LTR84_006421 [Exophiala bonariae]
METNISSSYRRCASSLEKTIANKDLEAEASSVPLALWEDVLVRLKLFASKIGAHQTGTMSLDYRLREATHLRDRLLKTLSSIDNAIEDMNEIIASRYLSSDNEEFMSAEERCNQLRDVYNTLQTLVDSMFHLSMTIRKPGRVQRIQNFGEEAESETSFLNSLDLRRITDNFPYASIVLRQRLTTATARRRKTLKYLERRHHKLQKGIDGGDDEEGSTVLSSLVATALVENDLEHQTSKSDIGGSETSFGTSLFSSSNRRTIPPPPEASHDGKPFECLYCFYIIRIS